MRSASRVSRMAFWKITSEFSTAFSLYIPERCRTSGHLSLKIHSVCILYSEHLSVDQSLVLAPVCPASSLPGRSHSQPYHQMWQGHQPSALSPSSVGRPIESEIELFNKFIIESWLLTASFIFLASNVFSNFIKQIRQSDYVSKKLWTLRTNELRIL